MNQQIDAVKNGAQQQLPVDGLPPMARVDVFMVGLSFLGPALQRAEETRGERRAADSPPRTGTSVLASATQSRQSNAWNSALKH